MRHGPPTILLLSLALAPAASTGAGPEVVVQTRPEGVRIAALSPDGSLLATAGETLQLWDTKTGAQLRVLRSERSYALGFHPDGLQVAVTGEVGNVHTIELLDPSTGLSKHSLRTGHQRAEGRIAFSADGRRLATGTIHSPDILVLATSGRPNELVQVPARRPFALSADGAQLAAADPTTGAVRLWDTRGAQPIGAPSPVKASALAFTPSGEVVALGEVGGQKGLYVWRPGAAPRQVVAGSWGRQPHLALSPGGDVAVVLGASSAFSVGLADGKTGWQRSASGEYADLRITEGGALAVERRGQSKQAIFGGATALTVHDLRAGQEVARIEGRGQRAPRAVFAGDFVLFDEGKVLRVFDARTGQARAPLPCGQPFSAQARADRVACVRDGQLEVLALSTGLRIGGAAPTFGKPPYNVALSPDGRTVAVAMSPLDDGTTLELYRVDDFERLGGLKVPRGEMAFSPDGRLLAIASGDKYATLVDVPQRKVRRRLSVPSGERGTLEGVAFSADGRTVIVGGDYYSHAVHRFRVSDGRRQLRLRVREQGSVNLVHGLPEDRVLAGGQDGRLRIWNARAKQPKIIDVTPDMGVGLVSVSVSDDAKHALVVASYESRVFLYDLESGARVLTFALLGDEDWVAVSPDGRFDGSDGGLRDVRFVQGLRTVSLEALFERLHTPRLLARVLRGEAAAVDAPKLGEVLRDRPPSIEILEPADGAEMPDATVKVRARVKDEGGGIDEVRLYHNGKLAFDNETRGLKRKGVQDRVFELALVPGDNRIEVVALSLARTESPPATVHVQRKAAEPRSRLFLVVAGVSEYLNARYRLAYARPDAEAFLAAMRKHTAGLHAELVVAELYDAEATRQSIEAAFARVAQQAHPEDVFVFYYAGHGTMSEGGAEQAQFYLAPHDVTHLYGDEAQLAAKGLSATRLRELSVSIAARKQVHVLDACQSGGAVEAFAVRGAAEERAIVQLARSAGVVVLAAAGSDQYATEVKALGHGIFTYALLQGLAGEADGGRAPDGKVTIKELEAFLNDRVPALTRQYRGDAQYPTSFARGQDFPLTVP